MELDTDIQMLDDGELRAQLKNYGFQAGPIQPTTRSVLEKRLRTLMLAQGIDAIVVENGDNQVNGGVDDEPLNDVDATAESAPATATVRTVRDTTPHLTNGHDVSDESDTDEVHHASVQAFRGSSDAFAPETPERHTPAVGSARAFYSRSHDDETYYGGSDVNSSGGGPLASAGPYRRRPLPSRFRKLHDTFGESFYVNSGGKQQPYYSVDGDTTVDSEGSSLVADTAKPAASSIVVNVLKFALAAAMLLFVVYLVYALVRSVTPLPESSV